MVSHKEFDVELDGAPVRGRLALPDPRDDLEPPATVLICHGLPVLGPETEELLTHIGTTFVEAGLAVATIAHGSAGAPGARLAVESIDDAAAIFHRLALREELDLNRIGVLGHSLGGIVAGCLSRRTDQISRLCLLAPATTADVLARLVSESEEDLAQRLGAPSVPPGFFEGLDALTPAVDLVTHDRPTLIVHGAADRVVPPESSLAYRDAIASAGREVEHVLVALGDHVFSTAAARTACLDKLTHFFRAAGRTPAATGRP